MKRNHDVHNDDFFKKIIKSDLPNISPNPAIEERLQYYFQLQHSRKKLFYNSFSGFFAWMFSKQLFFVKTGLVLVSVLFFIIKSPVTNNHFITGDTCASRVMMADTNILVNDTCVN